MFHKVKILLEKTVVSIKAFKEDPINNLAYLLVVAMTLNAIISGIVLYIMFVARGGYSQQIEFLEKEGLDGISAGFTTGTVGLITTGITSKIMCGLVMAEFVVMMINYFKKNTRIKKIIMIVDLVFIAIIIVLATAIFWVAFADFVITEQDAYKYLGAFVGIKINIGIILILYLSIAVISFITYLVLIFTTEECRWMVGYTVFALLFSNMAVPLFFLVLENIIPLVTGAITLLVIGVLIFFGFKIFLSGVDQTDTPSKNRGGGNYSVQREVVHEARVETKPSNQKEIKCWSGPFWRDKGGYGILVPQADCIYVKNMWGEQTYVCTVCDFEKGNVAIIDYKTKSRVMNIAGCKTPEK